MKYYNHINLDQLADDLRADQFHPHSTDQYSPIFDCEILEMSNTHFRLYTASPLSTAKGLIRALKAIYNVEKVKALKKRRFDIFLKVSTHTSAYFIEKFHRTYDQVMQQMEVKEPANPYPVPPVDPHPVKTIINISKSILDQRGLIAEEKALYGYYYKIRRLTHNTAPHPYFTGSDIVDMIIINNQAKRKSAS